MSSISTLVINGRSAETDMYKADLLYSYFAECFNKSQPPFSCGNDMCAVFFDLRKVFDSMPHKLLLNELVEINTDPHLIKCIADYLREHYNVGVNGASSSPLPVISGVP